MDIQEVIAHDQGLWAAAAYFNDWLAAFEPVAPEAAREELHWLRGSLQTILADGAVTVHNGYQLREATAHALYLAQLYDAPQCDIKCFRKWLSGVENVEILVNYTLAAADYILDTYVWAITTEMQELRTLRKGLLANWCMLREMRWQLDANNAEDQASVNVLEENVHAMLARCRNLLKTYGEI